MMREASGRQGRLFYAVDLEEMVPADHLLRRIDAVLDLSWLRGEMMAHYSHLGCPSVCPELMIRMQLIGMESAIILDVEATPTRISKDVDATETMIERTEERFALKPKHLAGDAAYGTGKMVGWLVKRDIEPQIPVWDKAARHDGSLSRTDFAYDRERDVYVCLEGKTLKTTGRVHGGKTLPYRSSKVDCDACPLKARCCPTTRSRKIPRDVNEAARDRTRALMETEAYASSCAERKKIEGLFGEVKHILSVIRLRLRAPLAPETRGS